MEKQKKQCPPFCHNHGGDVLSLGLSADVSKLRAELKALGGLFDAIVQAVEGNLDTPRARFLEVHDAPGQARIPEEHMVSYI